MIGQSPRVGSPRTPWPSPGGAAGGAPPARPGDHVMADREPPSPLIHDDAWTRLQQKAEADDRQVREWRAAEEHHGRLNAARIAVEEAGLDYEERQEAGQAYLEKFVRALANYKALVARSADPKV